MLTTCDLPVFISKLSEFKQVEFSGNFLADFASFNYLCSTWMVLATLSDLFPIFIKIM